MQHPHDLPHHLQLFRRNIQPAIESFNQLRSDLFTRMVGEVGIWFEEDLNGVNSFCLVGSASTTEADFFLGRGPLGFEVVTEVFVVHANSIS